MGILLKRHEIKLLSGRLVHLHVPHHHFSRNFISRRTQNTHSAVSRGRPAPARDAGALAAP
jgi:hypothetical protein